VLFRSIEQTPIQFGVDHAYPSRLQHKYRPLKSKHRRYCRW
jgi:hypothetical protein